MSDRLRWTFTQTRDVVMLGAGDDAPTAFAWIDTHGVCWLRVTNRFRCGVDIAFYGLRAVKIRVRGLDDAHRLAEEMLLCQ